MYRPPGNIHRKTTLFLRIFFTYNVWIGFRSLLLDFSSNRLQDEQYEYECRITIIDYATFENI